MLSLGRVGGDLKSYYLLGRLGGLGETPKVIIVWDGWGILKMSLSVGRAGRDPKSCYLLGGLGETQTVVIFWEARGRPKK